MGGKPTAGMGGAAGRERPSSLINLPPKKNRPVPVVPIGDLAEDAVLPIVSKLRQNGLSVDLGYRGNLSKRMKRANALNSSFAVILGEDDISKGTAIIRNLDTGDQQGVEIKSLCKLLS
jgi:Histidyl-tRNA synthetase